MSSNPNVNQDVIGVASFRSRTDATAPDAGDARHFIPLDVLAPEIRQSGMGSLARCSRKFLYEVRFGLKKQGFVSAPFVGQVVHLMMNAKYKGLDSLSQAHILQAVVNDVKADCEASAAENGKVDLAAKISNDVESNAALGGLIADVFDEKFPLDPKRYRVIALEKDLRVKVPKVSAPIGGRVDLVLEHLGDPHGLVIVDHKSSSMSPKEWIKSAGFSWQMKLYRLLVESAPEFQGQKVIGGIFNCMRRPTCKLKVKQTLRDYLEECRGWYAAKSGDGWDWSRNQIPFMDDPPLRQFFLPFSGPVLDEEFENWLLVNSKALTCRPTLANFPRTGEASGACKQQYGRPCPYLDFCSIDPINWEHIMKLGNWGQRSDMLSESPEDYT